MLGLVIGDEICLIVYLHLVVTCRFICVV